MNEVDGERRPNLDWKNQAVWQGFELFSRVANVFGIPAATLLLCFGVVWFFGTPKTQDDFIREVLFQGVTSRPYLSVFFAGLVLASMVGALRAAPRRNSLEKDEMRRLASERSRLQRKLLGDGLGHSVPPDNNATEEKLP